MVTDNSVAIRVFADCSGIEEQANEVDHPTWCCQVVTSARLTADLTSPEYARNARCRHEPSGRRLWHCANLVYQVILRPIRVINQRSEIGGAFDE